MNPSRPSGASLSRRIFLAAGAVQAVGTTPTVIHAAERIRCGVIGTGGRGRYLTANFLKQGADVVAVCDVYEPNLSNGLKAASEGARPFVDYRKMLEDKSIDAVVIATPDHWHSRMAVDAMAAGKDVYLEKPMARSIEEGFAVVEAARAGKLVVQVGTQRRSYDLCQEAKAAFDSGVCGEVHLVNAWWLNYWNTLTPGVLQGKLDWDLFLGPAPKRELDPVRYFNWLMFWDYSAGLLVGQGAHIMDSIHWMMNSRRPLAVTCSAGKPNIDGAEVPETTCLTVEYPENYLAVFTVGYKAMHYNFSIDQMQQYHGTKARFDLGREAWAVYRQTEALEVKAEREVRRTGSFEPASGAHIRNFLDCVKSRRDPNATVEMGQAATMVLSMAVQSLRTGRRVRWNESARRAEV